MLVVEDSLLVGHLIVNRIQKEFDSPVLWAKSLFETKKQLDSNPDAISMAVLDFNLPDASNGEVIEEVIKQDIPSIVFTSDVEDKVRDWVWSHKVLDYQLKSHPNSIDNVVESLKRITRNSQSKILVVDDSPVFRELLADWLRVQQYQVFTASSGKQALKMLHEIQGIKLVVTDYLMPGMNGDVLCREIRRNFNKEDLSIIGVSSEKSKKMATLFLKNGANDFLIKQSFLVEEFYCRVNQCIDIVDLVQRNREAATKDYLSSLFNRRYLFETGNKLYANFKRGNISLTCAMIDIDYFKQINDRYGHDIGDMVIKSVSKTIQSRMRESDIVARFGGEEFCILAVNMDISMVEEIFNGLREMIQKNKVVYNSAGDTIDVKVSIGVSTKKADNLEDFIRSADELLYMAKHKGRNNVVISGDSNIAA